MYTERNKSQLINPGNTLPVLQHTVYKKISPELNLWQGENNESLNVRWIHRPKNKKLEKSWNLWKMYQQKWSKITAYIETKPLLTIWSDSK